MDFLKEMKNMAKNNLKTIVMPETEDVRTIEAASHILSEGLANLILVGNKREINTKFPDFNIDKATCIDPKNYDKMSEMVNVLTELRKAKGMTEDKALALLTENSLYFGVMLVKMELADGMVAGAINPTADVLRPSLQILKMNKESKIVSSYFIMVMPNEKFGEKGVFAYSDCGLIQNPNSEELAYIAIDTAKTFKKLIKAEPKVAMLSHSTKGSAAHDDVTKVVEATEKAKALAPDLLVDGELQLDAAIVPAVGEKKAQDSKVAGYANVLVFPDLDAGNIGYKLTQRLAGAEAYGPLTQGIAKPVNDLSRGCSAEDIVGVVAITAVQASL
ncbi:MAG: phosphate acetyltransferase [Lachnospirales bacterium]